MNTPDRAAQSKSSQRLPIDAIAAAEEADLARLRSLSMEERSELLAIACCDAAAIEESRRQMGFREPVPAPWPQSTWDFLREQTRRAREQ